MDIKNFDDKVIYEGLIRDGEPGTLSKTPFKVRHNEELDLSYLDPFPKFVEEQYISGQYRENYDGSKEIEGYYKLHENDVLVRSAEIGININKLRGKTVGDIGCGGGLFLDLFLGIAGETIAVEPNNVFQKELTAKGHKVFQTINDLHESKGKYLDYAICLMTIEHIENPLNFLTKLVDCIKPGGKLIVTTPNCNEILMKMNIPGFNQFYYRTVHFWYFSMKSMYWLGEKTNIKVVRSSFKYRYDAANFMRWLRDQCPTGKGGIDELFDNHFNQFFSSYLVSKGLADDLIIEYEIIN